MTVEFWTGAERIYQFWLVVLGLILVLIIFTKIIIAMNAKKENKKKILTAFLVEALGAIVAGLFGHFHYRPYLKQACYVNPLVRDREPRFVGYNYYGERNEQPIHN